jgi:hypothetical protein
MRLYFIETVSGYIYFPAHIPAKTRPRPARLLRAIFAKEAEILSPIARLTLSRPKEEKVVRPPRNPVTKNRRKAGLRIPLWSAIAKANPMRKHPTRLTIRVPQGNPDPKYLTARSVVPYRQRAPIPPPASTSSMLIITKSSISDGFNPVENAKYTID